MTLSSITARNRSARDKNRAVFLTGVLQEKRLSFYLSDVILVNRGVAVIFDQIDGINVFIKNARLNNCSMSSSRRNFTQVPQEELSLRGTGISIGFFSVPLR